MTGSTDLLGPLQAGSPLRPGLLDGCALAIARPAAPFEAPYADRLRALAEELGARVGEIACERDGEIESEERDVQAATAAALGALGALDLLAVDAGAMCAPHGGRDELVSCLAACWSVTRAAAEQALLERGGRIALIAPPRHAGQQAGAAAASLENLARTLSIEWARHGVTTVAIAAGEHTTPDELATLVCYLASPAGAYFSGCLLDLRGP